MGSVSALPLEQGACPTSDDAALVRAAQEDRAAFGQLYDRYVDRVYAYMRARTENEDDAADLTQHVFVQALRALPQYRVQSAPFAAWLLRIARNAAIDAHRRRRSTVAWDLIPEALQPVAQHDLEAGAARQEDLGRLRAILQRLDTDSRELLALRFAAGLTVAEMASVIGKSEAATKKRLARTLGVLKEQYHDQAR